MLFLVTLIILVAFMGSMFMLTAGAGDDWDVGEEEPTFFDSPQAI